MNEPSAPVYSPGMLPDSSIADPEYQGALRWLYGLSPNVRTAAEIVADHPRKLARTRALLDRLGQTPSAPSSACWWPAPRAKARSRQWSECDLAGAGRQDRPGHLAAPDELVRADPHRWRRHHASRGRAPDARIRAACRAARKPSGRIWRQSRRSRPGWRSRCWRSPSRTIEIAVVECGVGGLHDATNVLDPLAVALGPISYDHTGTLGPTPDGDRDRESGIFRAVGWQCRRPQPAEALAVVEQRRRDAARSWSSSGGSGAGGLTTIGRPRRLHDRGTARALRRPDDAAARPAPARERDSCRGAGDGRSPRSGDPHALPRSKGSRMRPPPPEGADDRSARVRSDAPGLAAALARAAPGASGAPWLVVDGAHNGDSAVRLAEALAIALRAPPAPRIWHVDGQGRPPHARRAAPDRLDRHADALAPRASVPLDGWRRRWPSAASWRRSMPEVRDAVGHALGQAAADDLVIVTGSLFVVGEVLEAYGERRGGRPTMGRQASPATTHEHPHPPRARATRAPPSPHSERSVSDTHSLDAPPPRRAPDAAALRRLLQRHQRRHAARGVPRRRPAARDARGRARQARARRLPPGRPAEAVVRDRRHQARRAGGRGGPA